MADRNNPDRRVWVCPVCGAFNVWCWADQERAALILHAPVVVCHGSAFDNVCGACGADLVRADSPILAECYTHVAQH